MIRRLYHCSCVNFNNKKQGIKLCKMINPRNKKQWYSSPSVETHAMPSIKSLTKTKYEPGKRATRRLAVLNKLFMKYISDIMSTGTVSMNVVGRGIEISQVKITPDFQTVNVFWICKGNSRDDETENLLNSVAGVLRHELSTLRLMGEVPFVVFVKDKQEAHLVDLDRRLAVADYGEDYTPTELGHILKTEFTVNTKLSPEMKAKIKQLEDQDAIDEEPIPEMTHNVFGLDHAKIMNRLLASRKKLRDSWNSLDSNTSDNVISYRASPAKRPEIDIGKQKKELAEFLLQRQINERKQHKKMRDAQLDVDQIYADNKSKDEKADVDPYLEDLEEYEEYEDFYNEAYELKHGDENKR